MGIIFIDERVLAPSYSKYRREIDYVEKVEEIVEGEKVYLPLREFRKEMTTKLKEEINRMSKKELLITMNRIKKDYIDEVSTHNSQYGTFVYSWKMLEANYPTSLSRRDKSRNYSLLEHVRLAKGRNYIYLEKEFINE